MKLRTPILGLFCLVVAPCAFSQTAAIDRAEILGRLAQGYWPSYVAHLVKKRGVNFSPSPDFIEKVKLAGGEGVLVERLYAADVSEQAHSASGAEAPYEHLAKCAEIVHQGGVEQAEKECRVAIVENPKSAWPPLTTAKLLLHESSDGVSEEVSKKRKEERAKLVQRAAALAPDLASAHQGLASTMSPSRDAMIELQKASSLDPEGLEIYETGEQFNQWFGGFFNEGEKEGTNTQPSNETISIDPQLQRRIQLEPDLASNHAILSIRYLQVRNVERALAELQEAIRLEPENTALHLALAGYYMRQKNQEACLGELRESARIAPFDIKPRLMVAGVLEVSGRTPEAIEELQALVSANPTAAAPSEGLIEIYLEHKDRKSAIMELRRSLKASSLTFTNEAEFVEFRYKDEDKLANLLKEDRQLDAAAEQYIYMLRFKPEDSGLHNDYGNVLLDERKLDDAIAEYRESLRLDPEMSPAHNNIGLCLAQKKDLDGAISEFRQTLAMNPDEPHTQIYLGTALGQKGDVSGAKEQFEQAIQKDAKDPLAHIQLAYALAQLKDEAGAIKELKAALELKPDSAEAENDLAWVYVTAENQKLRNPTEALALARRAVKDSGPNAAYIDTLAEALLQNGQGAEAYTMEKQAAELDPQNPEMQKRLAKFREAVQQVASRKP